MPERPFAADDEIPVGGSAWFDRQDALIAATESGDLPAARSLVDSGANPFLKGSDPNVKIAFFLAIQARRLDFFLFFVESFDWFSPDRWPLPRSPFLAAVSSGWATAGLALAQSFAGGPLALDATATAAASFPPWAFDADQGLRALAAHRDAQGLRALLDLGFSPAPSVAGNAGPIEQLCFGDGAGDPELLRLLLDAVEPARRPSQAAHALFALAQNSSPNRSGFALLSREALSALDEEDALMILRRGNTLFHAFGEDAPETLLIALRAPIFQTELLRSALRDEFSDALMHGDLRAADVFGQTLPADDERLREALALDPTLFASGLPRCHARAEALALRDQVLSASRDAGEAVAHPCASASNSPRPSLSDAQLDAEAAPSPRRL